MPTNWTDQVSNSIANLKANTGRILNPARSLAIIDNVVGGKCAVGELAMIHGMPQEWIGKRLDMSRGWFRAPAVSGRLSMVVGMNSER